MKRTIEIGDIVTVYFSDGDQLIDAKVTWIPQDTGDMWYFEHKGNVHAVNPNSASLVEIIKRANGLTANANH